MNRKLTCEVCGGGDYYTDSGFYFCNECHAQSQEVVEEVINTGEAYVYGRSLSVKSNASTSSVQSVSTGHDWTTWECYNFVLKGLVDELISLGAPPELKLVVLQLWVILLKKLDVAFISSHHLPKLGFNYHDKDMFVVYGMSAKKKSRKVNKKKKTVDDQHNTSEETDVLNSSAVPLKRGVTKKALARADYASSRVDNPDDLLSSVLDDDLSDSSFGVPSTSSRKSFDRWSMFSRKAMEKFDKMKTKEAKPVDHKVRQRDPSYITRSRLLCILYLGLRLVDSNIFLGDVMRWISEGALSYHEVSQFFPACTNLKAVDGLLFGAFPRTVVHATVRKMSAELAKLLRVNAFPAPHVLSLAARYVEELQLPSDVLDCVRKMYAMHPPNMEFDAASSEVPNYEGRAMAFIIVVLKLLFGLDGKTEHVNSETAAEFNKYLSSEEGKLFVWDDWQGYVECRKAFVSLFHFPTKDAVCRDGHEGIELYIEELKQLREKAEGGNRNIFVKKERMNPSITSVLERTFQKLAALEPNNFSGIKFKPSLMPNTSYLEEISEVYTTKVFLEFPFPELLKQDFKATELKFLLDPYWLVKTARMKGMKIRLRHNSAQNKVKKVNVERLQVTNKLHCAYLEGVASSSGVKTALGPDSACPPEGGELRGGVAEQLPGDPQSEADDGVEYAFSRQNKRKRKSSSSGDARVSKKRDFKGGPCFRGKCAIGSAAEPEETGPEGPEGCFRINVPSSQYWILGIPHKRFFTLDKFDSKVMPRFTTSFRWLLSECAGLLGMTEYDLYTEVLVVEALHGYVLAPDSVRTEEEGFLRFVNHVKTHW
ncbi:TATA box-binding protein-associated factor RNA polymerase I subunit B isoform X2 [Bacillus rossius redtenbacheri]|uniref:TATA box-binding protein-associated factor RNA polymerase I subunit B isoform X2 n=1 Tax=Bacillus rossius redtenbacheri TaxID=93214 RepID=UPI002FDE7C94